MPKRERFLELPLRARPANSSLFRWLYDELREAIIAGRLAAGTRLPSSRSLAKQQGVARSTVIAAFDQLVAEGYLDCAVGRGTFVKAIPQESLLRAAPVASPEDSQVSRASLSSRGSRLARQPFPFDCLNVSALTLRLGVPDLQAFPMKVLGRIASRRLSRAAPKLLGYSHPLGFRPLRASIAAHVGLTRGIKCTTDQIVITSGTQQSLDLIARLVLDHDDPVWMEDPGYPPAVSLFRALGARVVGVPVDDAGLDCTIGSQRCLVAKLAYVTPGCQFPLGVTMSLQRRHELLSWARAHSAWIFEDDYDGEFRFSGRPLAALQTLDNSGCVIYSNTFNKVLFPSCRLGFLVVPPRLIESVSAVKSIIERCPPILDQAILCDFISEGHLDRHIRRMRELYASRFEILAQTAQAELDGLLDLSAAHAGLQVVGWLAKGIRDLDACRMAAARRVDSLALSSLTIDRSMPPAMVLGAASTDVPLIKPAIAELACVLRQLKRRSQA